MTANPSTTNAKPTASGTAKATTAAANPNTTTIKTTTSSTAKAGTTTASNNFKTTNSKSTTNSTAPSNKLSNEEYNKIAAKAAGGTIDSNGKLIFTSREQYAKYFQIRINLRKIGIDKNSTPEEIAAASVGIKINKNTKPTFVNRTQQQNYDNALKNIKSNSQSNVTEKVSSKYTKKEIEQLEIDNGTMYVWEHIYNKDTSKYDPYKRASQMLGGIPLRGNEPYNCGPEGKKAFEVALYGKASNVNNASVKNKYENDIRYKKLSDRVNSWDNIESYKKEFVMEVFPIILKYEDETGVPAEIIFGQMCSESSYGTETLTDKYTGKEANNYFGVKGSGPAGSVKCDTTEFIDGKRVHIVDEFKAYNNMDEAIKDYANLLNRKYKKYITTGTPEDWANALVKGGYATAPNYGEAILDVSKTWGIYE